MIKSIARRILLNPIVSNPLKQVVEFYNNQPVFPGQHKILSVGSLLFHVGNVMPMNDEDVNALHMVVKKASRPGMVAAEIGSWTGRSTSVIAQVAKNQNGQVYAIDHWQGNVGVWQYGITKEYDVFSIFRSNMDILGLGSVVKPMVMDSQSGASVFKDKSLDIVFIDADHRYKPVKDDIESWLPKVKKGGIISGHDCSGKYSCFPLNIQEQINANLDKDDLPGVGHPGVSKVLYECFDDNYEIVHGSCVWYKKA